MDKRLDKGGAAVEWMVFGWWWDIGGEWNEVFEDLMPLVSIPQDTLQVKVLKISVGNRNHWRLCIWAPVLGQKWLEFGMWRIWNNGPKRPSWSFFVPHQKAPLPLSLSINPVPLSKYTQTHETIRIKHVGLLPRCCWLMAGGRGVGRGLIIIGLIWLHWTILPMET